MGYYINPKDKTKEMWLVENALKFDNDATYEDLTINENVALVLINNGPFTALGIAYDKKEYNEFTNPNDYRPKKIFSASKELVLEVCPEAVNVLKERN